MKIFVCLDENGGMLFNKRRQSSDRVVREDMLRTVGENPLYVNSYTAKQFTEEETGRIVMDDNCLINRKDGYIFVENVTVSEYVSEIEEIIVYRWKRKYPADFFFDLDLNSADWKLTLSEEFAGHSHEVIGKEIYSYFLHPHQSLTD